MNITFLLGNGFDCALGLETSYSSFYRWYLEQPTDSVNPHVQNFRKEIDKYVQKSPDAKPYWSDVETGLSQYSENFTLDNIEIFFDCYEDLRNNLVSYLTQQEERLYTTGVGKMQEIFSRQIKKFIERVDAAERRSLLDVKNASKDKVHTFNFITFNYTTALDRVYSSFSETQTNGFGTWRNSSNNTSQLKVGRLVHAHGYLTRWPILGICNSSDVKNQDLLKDEEFSTIMLKKKSLRETGELWREDVEQLIADSTFICIFGMSLGNTDSDYWELLTKWLAADCTHHLIVFWRSSDSKNSRISLLEKRRETNFVKNKFSVFSWLTGDALDSVKSRIHVVLNTQDLFYLTKEELENIVEPSAEETRQRYLEEFLKANEDAMVKECAAHYDNATSN